MGTFAPLTPAQIRRNIKLTQVKLLAYNRWVSQLPYDPLARVLAILSRYPMASEQHLRDLFRLYGLPDKSALRDALGLLHGTRAVGTMTRRIPGSSKARTFWFLRRMK